MFYAQVRAGLVNFVILQSLHEGLSLFSVGQICFDLQNIVDKNLINLLQSMKLVLNKNFIFSIKLSIVVSTYSNEFEICKIQT